LTPVARRWPVVVAAMEVPSAGGAPQGATGVEVADAGSRLGDSVVGLLLHLVVRGTGAGVARSAAPGDEAPPPRSSSTVSPGVSGYAYQVLPALCLRPSTRGGGR
jgi:hypothetical protein